VPVQLALGTSHGCARLSDGTVRCWGDGTYGRLGNGTEQEQLVPKAVTGLEGVVDIVARGLTTCARLSDKTVSCWGSDFQKSTTGPVLAPASVGAQDNTSMAVSSGTLCVLNEQGLVFCKGGGLYGELGNVEPGMFGSDSDVFVLAQTSEAASVGVVQVASLNSTFLAVTENGAVLCWGIDKEGIGSDKQGFYCEGEGYPVGSFHSIVGKPVILPHLQSVTSVSGGQLSACAIVADGRVTCWGQNSLGLLGRGTSTENEIADFALGLAAVRHVAIGGAHVCAVTSDDKLFCWGSNKLGQLGAPCGAALPCQTSASDIPFVAVPTRVAEGVVEVELGDNFTCGVTQDAKVLCWGQNFLGQLGRGTKSAGEAIPAPVVWK
jgi:alpha-tubulin suppressor-like RCC1 family protein